MAYDEDLASRIRELLAGDSDVREMRMFGGLAFLVGGHMAIAASRNGGVMVRADPAVSEHLMATTPARPVEMRGRAMPGWLRVLGDSVRTRAELAEWVELGIAYARSLPPR